jgi:predicted polyphosphate/ATP-dependent NAD kinase
VGVHLARVQAEDPRRSVRRLGLIVNPLAGVGGRVGLKGSDGTETVRQALAMGAVREAPGRAQVALERLARLKDFVEIVTWPGEMGEDEASAAGFEPTVVGSLADHARLEADIVETTAADTTQAVQDLIAAGCELVLFAGGDGTARDICVALNGAALPVLGIPAGVKIHSAVYATTPSSAGDLAAMFLHEKPAAVRLREAEVMDIDEDAFRDGRVSASLFGYMTIPYERSLMQNAKTGGVAGDVAALRDIASEIVGDMRPGTLYLLGPGTTTRAITDALGLHGTLLGVDAIQDGALIATDAGEHRLLELLDGRPQGASRIVVTVIGGQGHIFGRGNQQFSPAVIRSVGRQNVVVVATQTKLLSLSGGPLLVDTGDPDLDAAFEGYIRVTTAHGEMTVYPVAAGNGKGLHPS